MRPPPDYTGRRFGRLVVLFQSTEWRPRSRTLWACQCDCGSPAIVASEFLRRGHTKSCGCLRRESCRTVMFAYNPTSAEWDGLLDTLCEAVTRFPQTPREIRSAFRDAWGECQERRFWRALRTLVDQGRVVQSGLAGSGESVYSLPVMWPRNLANCIAEAAATYAVFELGMRRAA